MRRLVQLVLRCLLLMTVGCGGGVPDTGASAAALAAVNESSLVPAAMSTETRVPVTPAAWVRQGSVRGLCCSYTPLAIKDGQPHFFSNVLNERREGEWFRFVGDWSAVDAGEVAVSASAITDVGDSNYKVRTSGVRYDPAVGWVAILRVGRGYPTEDGYVPAMATSVDGLNWTYRGKLKIDGRIWPAFADGANVILQMTKPAVLNVQQPFENRYVLLDTNFNIDGRARKLIAVVSADGVDWRFHRDAKDQVVDMWPVDTELSSDQPVFPSADSVQGDIHLVVGDRWRESASPVSAHRHLCAPRGSNTFRFLGNASTWRSETKVPNIAYDSRQDTLMAVHGGVLYALKSASAACR